MRVRVLHAKLYAYALPGSTARQLFISSTLLDSSTARQLDSYLTDLDRPRQHSTPRLMESGRVRLDEGSTGSTGSTGTRQARQVRPRQRLDSASTVPRRSLDTGSTARQVLDSQGSIRSCPRGSVELLDRFSTDLKTEPRP